MRQQFFRRQLSARMTRVLLLLIAAVSVLCGCLVRKVISVPVFILLLAAALGADCTLLVRWVWKPLRDCEAVLKPEGASLDVRLQRLSEIPHPERNPLGSALHVLGREVQGQYTAALVDTKSELAALQNQINPHFLYNTLDSIRGQALAEGTEDIADMTEALATFFRYSISNRKSIVTLEEELENVRDYFKIQQFRFNNRFHLRIVAPVRADLEECHLPKLTLQPIIENAILHGLGDKRGESIITVRVEGTEHLVRVTVSDNGVGMDGETLCRLQAHVCGETSEYTAKAHGGLALPNVARRIRLLFGEQYNVQIMSTPGVGTDIVLMLPRAVSGEKRDAN